MDRQPSAINRRFGETFRDESARGGESGKDRRRFSSARKAYESRGYTDVRVSPTRDLDDTAKLASYAVQVAEGSQYHMGQVYFDGLPQGAALALSKKWKLKPGDIYDASYPADFLKNTAGKELAQAGNNSHATAVKQEADATALIVNLHIQFH